MLHILMSGAPLESFIMASVQFKVCSFNISGVGHSLVAVVCCGRHVRPIKLESCIPVDCPSGTNPKSGELEYKNCAAQELTQECELDLPVEGVVPLKKGTICVWRHQV